MAISLYDHVLVCVCRRIPLEIELCAHLSMLSIPLALSILALYIVIIHVWFHYIVINISTMNNKVNTMVPACNIIKRDAEADIAVEAEAEVEA